MHLAAPTHTYTMQYNKRVTSEVWRPPEAKAEARLAIITTIHHRVHLLLHHLLFTSMRSYYLSIHTE
jgi:hypothetical protein